ncbi:class I SAM-dependent methyltransferase [Leptothoe sp. ISB3NOV94-8A]
MLSVSLREPQILTQLRQETAQHPVSSIQISPYQGQFMALLLRLMGAKKVLEIGTFTGYSALWMALALPSDGTLTACDVSEEYTEIARRYWQAAGVADKINLHLQQFQIPMYGQEWYVRETPVEDVSHDENQEVFRKGPVGLVSSSMNSINAFQLSNQRYLVKATIS